MSMKLYGKLGIGLHGRYQIICGLRQEKSGHILYTYGICAKVFDILGYLLPVIKCISITKCIRQSDLCMSAFLLGGLNCCLKVSQIIKTVKDTYYVYTVCN